MLDSIMSALGAVGDALDKPGRAVRGALVGKPQELLAAIPFSDTLGITDYADRTSGVDVLRAAGLDPGDGVLGGLAGFGAEMALDPSTYVGGFAGRMLGKAADAAQIAKGPGFATTADDLNRMLGDYNAAGKGMNEITGNIAGRRVDSILKSPDAARMLSEIPPQSSILGAGAEGIAFKTPDDDVLRIGRLLDGSAPGRPVSPDVLQATRGVDVGDKIPFRIERTPFADPVGGGRMFDGYRGMLDDSLADQGLLFSDPHKGNVGLVGGRPLVIDPGAVSAVPPAGLSDVQRATRGYTLDGFGGDFQSVARAADPGRGMDLLLRALGGQDAMRASLAAGGNSPGFANRLTAYGALAGAAPGRFGG